MSAFQCTSDRTTCQPTARPENPRDVRHAHLSELSFTLLQARRRGRIDLARRLAAELTQPELDLALSGGRSA
jgi:hypothetical protein